MRFYKVGGAGDKQCSWQRVPRHRTDGGGGWVGSAGFAAARASGTERAERAERAERYRMVGQLRWHRKHGQLRWRIDWVYGKDCRSMH
jgi:hypothetical protein